MNGRSLLGLATDAARRAGELLLERFSAPARGVNTKSSPTDLVSDADRDAERLLIELIRAERPDDGFVGEESGAKESRSGVSWIVDPLDGTVNFLFRIPVWSVSVAARSGGRIVAGVVYDPNRGEIYTAVEGAGAHVNGQPVAVSSCSSLDTALIGTGFSYEPRAREVQARTLLRALPRVRDIRRAGSAALDLAWVACGRLDGVYEAPMEPWDKAAGTLLVSEAGGVVSELPAPLEHLSSGVVCAGPALHDLLRSLLLSDGA